MITHVAIEQNGEVYSLPRPMRHHHVIKMMVDICGLPTPITGKQGFLDVDQGKYIFVDRRDALDIARGCRQVLHKENIRGSQLFSEDIW